MTEVIEEACNKMAEKALESGLDKAMEIGLDKMMEGKLDLEDKSEKSENSSSETTSKKSKMASAAYETLKGQAPDKIEMAKFAIKQYATAELLQLVGIGSGFASLNMMGFQLAQINKKLDEIKAQINIILGAPAIEAFDHLQRGIQSLVNKKYKMANDDFEKVIDRGIRGRQYESMNLQTVASLTKYMVFSDVMVNSFCTNVGKTHSYTFDDKSDMFIPYEQLIDDDKNAIRDKITDHLKALLASQKKQKTSFFNLPSTKQKLKEDNQNLVDEVLRFSLQFICPPGTPVPFAYIPQGMEDAALINLDGKPGMFEANSVHIWREEKEVIVRYAATGKVARIEAKDMEELRLESNPDGLTLDNVPLKMDFFDRSADLIQVSDDGKISEVKSLLMKGCDVNILVQDVATQGFRKISDTLNPLILACFRGHIDVVTILLQQPYVDVNKKDAFGNTALHMAAEAGHLEIVKLLVEKGADTTAEDNGGIPPKQLAKKGNHDDVYEYLCSFNALE